VTVLVGISYKKRPLMGIIGIPFAKIDGQRVFKPIVTVGSVIDK